MARGLNTVMLAGTIVQDPELRYTQNGLAILELNLAGNDHVIGEDGESRHLAWYHRATLFGAYAEIMVNQVAAGVPVLVEGRLNYSSWESPEGQRRSSINVNANRVEVLGFGARRGEATVIDAKGQPRLVDALNQVMLIGNLTRDAELRYTPSGTGVTRYSIAVNERYKDRTGQQQESTHFVDVTAWRDLAEACAELKKGDPVFVTGRLVNDSWTDKEGNKRFSTRIEASRVDFMTRGTGARAGGNGTPKAAASKGAQPAGARPRLDIDEEFPPEDDLPF